MEPIINETPNTEKKDKPKSKYVVRTPVDLQRIKVEKLMENPNKPMMIPMSAKEKNLMSAIPTFVRNVMGSSAGAGSGEFHVYRHLRRKEYARQKQIQHKSRQEELDDEYQLKLETNRLKSESKTAKKRAKRLKKKINMKNKAKQPKLIDEDNGKSTDDDNNDSNDNDSNNDDDAEENNVEKADDNKLEKADNKVEKGDDNNVEKADDDNDKVEKDDDPKEQSDKQSEDDIKLGPIEKVEEKPINPPKNDVGKTYIDCSQLETSVND